MSWEEQAVLARGCTACPELAATRQHVVFGQRPVAAPCDLVLLGEAPGAEEDASGLPFVGRSGRLLDTMLTEAGLARADVGVVNVVKCRPPGNRDPLPDEITACRPYLETQVDLIAPKVVVTLGNFATRLLLARTEGITRLRGRAYPFRSGVLVPTFHPSAALRGNAEAIAGMRADFVRAKEHLGLPLR